MGCAAATGSAAGLKPDDALAQQLAGGRGAVAVAMKNSKHDDAIFGSSTDAASGARDRGGGDRARRERARAAAARQADAKAAAAAAAAVETDPLRTVLRGLRDESDDDDDDDAPTVANVDELSALLADRGGAVAVEAAVVPIVAVAAASVGKPVSKTSWREKAAQARLARMN